MTIAGFEENTCRHSPFSRLDSRAKIVAVFLSIVAVSSIPATGILRFAGCYAILMLLCVISHVPVKRFQTRCLVASPFVLASGAMIPVSLWLSDEASFGWQHASAGLAVMLKGYAAVLLLTTLTATTRWADLLSGFRRLRFPAILLVIWMCMHRYTVILLEEWNRTTVARESRTPGRLRMPLHRVLGNQVGLILVRSWSRAERLQAAMASRGFDGSIRLASSNGFSFADVAFAALVPMTFLIVGFA